MKITTPIAAPFLIAQLASLLIAGICNADTLVESYSAHLSDRDHYSSSGERLRNAAAIIRQDRANFHKFRLRDPGDQSDGFFANANNRQTLEQMINSGKSSPSALRSIVNGTPNVTVNIFRSDSGQHYVNVQVGGNAGGPTLEEPDLVPAREADELVESYAAHLSEQDHYSSSGAKLGNAAAIIRQDRANFHKFGLRDPMDQSDSYFAKASNREALEQMLNRGKTNKSISRMIVNGTPVVVVKVYRTASGSHYVNITPAQ